MLPAFHCLHVQVVCKGTNRANVILCVGSGPKGSHFLCIHVGTKLLYIHTNAWCNSDRVYENSSSRILVAHFTVTM